MREVSLTAFDSSTARRRSTAAPVGVRRSQAWQQIDDLGSARTVPCAAEERVRTAGGAGGAAGNLAARTRMLAALLLCVLAILGTPGAAMGQGCGEGWLPGEALPGTNGVVVALAVLPGGDVIVGGNFTSAAGVAATNIARYSPTTGVWSALGTGTNGTVLSLAVLPGGDVLVGGIFTSAGGVAASRIARYNPTTGVWSALGTGTNGQVSALAVLPGGDVLVGGFFTTAGGVAATNIARYNPTTGVWSALGAGTSGTVNALTVLPGGDVLVGGNFTTAGSVVAGGIARYNPSTDVWSALGTGTNGQVSALAVLPGGDVLVGGTFTSAGGVAATNIARHSPTTGVWSALGTGTNSQVSALAVLPGGDVLVGGGFNTAGGVAATNIARYSPTTGVWSALGTGTNGTVLSLAVLPGGDVLVGGSFTSAGGVAASRIARYNPITGVWSALGAGTTGTVNALTVLPGGDVFVGGSFTTAGGVVATNIARYNPTTGVWSALGAGTSGTVNALTVLPGGDVLAGGTFTTAGGVVATNIARYNPTTGVWSALGAGTTGTVNALTVLPGGDVLVGGNFTTAGSVVASRIARYNPSTDVWSALGTGTNGQVSALAVLPGGDVVVGGNFTSAGGVAATNIARYNPTTDVWSALGTGTNDAVLALAVLPGGDVLVGGFFSTAGGVAASRIARHNPTTGVWSALGAGTSGQVSALAVLPGGDVLAGGVFTTAGSGASVAFARYTFGGPPSVVVHPVSTTRCSGSTATLSVVATGAPPLTYQWRRNGVAIPGAVNASLAIASVAAGDGGSYACVITNPCGSVITNAMTLTVNANATLSITSQPVSVTRCVGAAATLSVTATGTSPLSYQWRRGGVNIPGATSARLSIGALTAADGGSYDCVITNGCGSETSTPATLTVNTPVVITGFFPTVAIRCSGGSATFAVAHTGTGTITYQWRRNGVNIPGATARTYTIDSVSAANAGLYTVVVTGPCGPVTSTAASLTVNTAPAITVQPTSLTRCIGTAATLSVTATGTSPLSYQWRRGGVNIPGATSARLTIGSLATGDGGSYDCVIANGCGFVTSNAAILTISSPVVITTQPTGLTRCAGQPASFTVDHTGTGTITYQWRRNGANIPGATSSTYAISSVSPANAGLYTVVVTGACGPVTSTAVRLTVNTAPAITVQPISLTRCVGTNATLSVTATGTPPLSFQWRRNGVNIPGAASAALTITSLTTGNGGSYDCVITNGCGIVTSNTINLTVNTPVVITTQPAGLALCAGSSASFSVQVAPGSGTVRFQWRRGTANIAGATASTFTIPAVTPGSAGLYSVAITGPCGTSVVSSPATLTVNAPTTVLSSPTNQVICRGSGAALTVTAAGSGQLTFRWRKNGVELSDGPVAGGATISGATTSSLSLTNSSVQDNGVYTCTVTSPCGGSATSLGAQLTVNGCNLLIGACSLADVAGGGETGRTPNGVLDSDDFIAFMNSFGIGDPAVDPLADVAGGDTGAVVDPDGLIDGTDLIAFVNAFAAGCP